jgi:hypothetical protein
LLELTGSERALGAPPDALQNLLTSECERGLFGHAELADAARALGLGPGGTPGALAENPTTYSSRTRLRTCSAPRVRSPR